MPRGDGTCPFGSGSLSGKRQGQCGRSNRNMILTEGKVLK